MERERERKQESVMQSLFSFPFFHVRRLFHPFRLHPILIARISAEKSFCMPFHHVALARRNTGEHTHRHGIVITVFFRTVSLVVHPHFTVPSFLFFFPSSLPLHVYSLCLLFFSALPPTIPPPPPPLRYVSTPFHDTRNLTLAFLPMAFPRKTGTTWACDEVMQRP